MKVLDVVLIKDGQEGTIVEMFDDGAMMIEVTDKTGKMLELPIIKAEEIEKITYVA